jgi:hypothetical protein
MQLKFKTKKGTKQEENRVVQAAAVKVQTPEVAGNRKGNLWQEQLAELLSSDLHKIKTKLARRRRNNRNRTKRWAMKTKEGGGE